MVFIVFFVLEKKNYYEYHWYIVTCNFFLQQSYYCLELSTNVCKLCKFCIIREVCKVRGLVELHDRGEMQLFRRALL